MLIACSYGERILKRGRSVYRVQGCYKSAGMFKARRDNCRTQGCFKDAMIFEGFHVHRVQGCFKDGRECKGQIHV